MRPKTWKILDLGPVPEGSKQYPMHCFGCGVEAYIPVVGLPLSQCGGASGYGGLIFDIGGHAMPTTIKCRSCGKVFTNKDED
jgi:hypothetical protein